MSMRINDEEKTEDYNAHCPKCGTRFTYIFPEMHAEYYGELFNYIKSYVCCPKCNNKVYV